MLNGILETGAYIHSCRNKHQVLCGTTNTCNIHEGSLYLPSAPFILYHTHVWVAYGGLKRQWYLLSCNRPQHIHTCWTFSCLISLLDVAICMLGSTIYLSLGQLRERIVDNIYMMSTNPFPGYSLFNFIPRKHRPASAQSITMCSVSLLAGLAADWARRATYIYPHGI